jgi:pSer/pThr/pTyr-binding forkhead associated (FHA) protein
MPVEVLIFETKSKQLIQSTIQNKSSFILGRSTICDIAIPIRYTRISAQHITIRDMGTYLDILDGSQLKTSTNGVFVSGKKIPSFNWSRVDYGSIISLGNPTDASSLQLIIKTLSERPIAITQAESHALQPYTAHANTANSQLANSGQPIHVALVRPQRTRNYSRTLINLATHLAILFTTIILIITIGSTDLTGYIIGIILLILELYFLPTTIAFCRGLPNKFSIFAINLLLGLTLIGWAVSLAWSVSAR